jgi:hypothetical protein
MEVAAAQPLLFPDPKPLVERLGADFFRGLPEGAGVYLMCDAGGKVLYVGKAKNLRKRLCSYRVANPDRLPKRHLRLLRSVDKILLEHCASESSALAREAELLRQLRPRFNRAGTWAPPPRYFAWRQEETFLEFTVVGEQGDGWSYSGPMGSRAVMLRVLLARLLWLACRANVSFTSLPLGWAKGMVSKTVRLDCGELVPFIVRQIAPLLEGDFAPFAAWICLQRAQSLALCEQNWLMAELDLLAQTVRAERTWSELQAQITASLISEGTLNCAAISSARARVANQSRHL